VRQSVKDPAQHVLHSRFRSGSAAKQRQFNPRTPDSPPPTRSKPHPDRHTPASRPRADPDPTAKVDDLVDRIIVGGAADIAVLHGAVRTLGELMPAMDAKLVRAIERSEDFISPQQLLTLYLVAHRERYGPEFQAN
jgi:hypothetical protein